ncbi:hypothetical protein AtNW77_Chr5g0121351 [Arabidopsis thaliana]
MKLSPYVLCVCHVIMDYSCRAVCRVIMDYSSSPGRTWYTICRAIYCVLIDDRSQIFIVWVKPLVIELSRKSLLTIKHKL